MTDIQLQLQSAKERRDVRDDDDDGVRHVNRLKGKYLILLRELRKRKQETKRNRILRKFDIFQYGNSLKSKVRYYLRGTRPSVSGILRTTRVWSVRLRRVIFRATDPRVRRPLFPLRVLPFPVISCLPNTLSRDRRVFCFRLSLAKLPKKCRRRRRRRVVTTTVRDGQITRRGRRVGRAIRSGLPSEDARVPERRQRQLFRIARERTTARAHLTTYLRARNRFRTSAYTTRRLRTARYLRSSSLFVRDRSAYP